MKKIILLLLLISKFSNAALLEIGPTNYLDYTIKFYPGLMMASTYEIGQFWETSVPIFSDNDYVGSELHSSFQTSPGASILMDPSIGMPANLSSGTSIRALMGNLVWTENWTYEGVGRGEFWGGGIFAFRYRTSIAPESYNYGYAHLSGATIFYDEWPFTMIEAIDFGQFETTRNKSITVVPEPTSFFLTVLAGVAMLNRRNR
jgi:hypothetical protein